MSSTPTSSGSSDRGHHIQVVQPAHFPRPMGYANGMVASGRTLYVAGQVGWNVEQRIVSDELTAQFTQALDNVLDVVRASGGQPTDIVNMTVFVTDLAAYKSGVKAIGAAWRERMGRHFPAMALVGVAGLVEDGAKVEIQAVACLPEG